MPLSDREQQILSDIEARLRADDPKFARAVGETTVTSHLRRRIRLAVAGFILGFLLLFFVVTDYGLGFGIAGFALMLASVVYGGNMLKRLGQDQNTRLGGQLRGGLDRYIQQRRERREDRS